MCGVASWGQKQRAKWANLRLNQQLEHEHTINRQARLSQPSYLFSITLLICAHLPPCTLPFEQRFHHGICHHRSNALVRDTADCWPATDCFQPHVQTPQSMAGIHAYTVYIGALYVYKWPPEYSSKMLFNVNWNVGGWLVHTCVPAGDKIEADPHWWYKCSTTSQEPGIPIREKGIRALALRFDA